MRQALIAGWLAFVVLMLGASPAHFWLDSGEISAAGVELGVIHPPGAPGYALVLRAATAVGIGSLGFRLSVVSSALAAGSLAGVFALLRARGAHSSTCWVMVLWLLGGWTFARHGRVVEIYALAAALLVVVLWGFDPLAPERQKCARRVIGTFASVWAALCFGDLRLALGLPVLAGWLVALRRGQAWAAWAPIAVVAALCTVAAVILASAGGPMSDWGGPDTAAALWEHLQAGTIRAAYADEILPRSLPMWQLNFEAFVSQLSEDLGPPGLALTGLCLLTLWIPRAGRARAKESRRGSALVAAALTWLLGVELFYAVGINPMGIADRQTGMAMFPVAALVVGEQLRRVVGERRLLRWAVIPLVATILVLPAALVGFDDGRATSSWVPHAWTRKAIDRLPPGTLLLTQSDDLSAGMAAARMLEGARPDMTSIPAQHLHKPLPDPLVSKPTVLRAWREAQRASGEAERIERFVAAWPAPVALEHPATAVLGRIPLWPEHGALPVRWSGPGALPRTPPVQQARMVIEHWSPRMHARPDRERLATALANHARGLARVYGDVDAASAVLELVLSQVTAHHAGTLVALAALRDYLGDTPQAIELTRRALVLEPGRAVALENLALYLSRSPVTLPQALQYAERAVALRPWRAEAWNRLATVHEQAGNTEAAASARQQARAASP